MSVGAINKLPSASKTVSSNMASSSADAHNYSALSSKTPKPVSGNVQTPVTDSLAAIPAGNVHSAAAKSSHQLSPVVEDGLEKAIASTQTTRNLHIATFALGWVPLVGAGLGIASRVTAANAREALQDVRDDVRDDMQKDTTLNIGNLRQKISSARSRLQNARGWDLAGILTHLFLFPPIQSFTAIGSLVNSQSALQRLKNLQRRTQHDDISAQNSNVPQSVK